MFKLNFTYNSNPTIINVRSHFGLGDSLIDFIFFSQIAKYIEDHNIHINYRCKNSHHANLHMFNSSNNIHILPYSNIGYLLWQGNEPLSSGNYVEDILCNMFNKFLKIHNIPIILNKFEYKDSVLLIKNIDIPPLNIDTLIINSTPTSGQFIHDKNELNNFIIELSKTRNVAVTEYLNESIPSLHNKSVRTIAAIAKTVKTIIAINTGPSLGLYNSDILNTVNNVYILDTTDHYLFKTRKFTKCNKISNLTFLLNNNSEHIHKSVNTIEAYCKYGLGDSLICFIFFSQIKDYIESHNIHINYYCNEMHHKNLYEFNSSPNIHLLPYENKGYHLWQGTENLKSGKYIEDILCDMFNKFLAFHEIPIVLDKFEYRDSDLLIEDVNIENQGIDTLIINSTPKSCQFSYDMNELNLFITELSKTKQVAVTEYLNDSIISLHDKSIRYVAAIAKTAKTVIAINTGPSLGLYNTEVLDAVDNVYLLDNAPYADYKFKTRKFTKYTSLSELRFLL